MTFDNFATYSLLEVKFLHLQNHSHHQRGASMSCNLQEGVNMSEYNNPVVMEAPLLITKGGVQETLGSGKAEFSEDQDLKKKKKKP